MRPNAIVVIAPSADDHLSFHKAVEDLQLQALVLELCSEMGALLQVSAMLVPCTTGTLIWRSVAMICSELNLSFSVLSSLVAGQFSQSTCSGATLTVRG